MSQLSGFSRILNLLPHPNKKSRRRTRPAADRWRTRLSFETLERREVLSSVPIVFTIPPDVEARGVEASIFATMATYNGQAYVNNQGTSIANGTVAYYNSAINDYDIPTTASDLTFNLTVTSGTATVNVSEVGVTSGDIVIGVGGGLNVTFASGGIGVPTSSTNPTAYFGLFEYSVTPNGANTTFDWNIDLSLVDQIGFPFTVTATPTPAAPANNGVGTNLNRGDLFNEYGAYIASQGAAAAPFMDSLTAGGGYRITSPSNTLNLDLAPVLNSPTYNSGPKKNAKLNVGTTYYYWVTAINQYGESAPGVTNATPYAKSGKPPVNYQTVNLSWSPVPGATGYKVYRSTTNDPTTATLAAWLGNSTSFPDTGKYSLPGTPPTTAYTYQPLNGYFNNDIDNFFAYYEAAAPTVHNPLSGHTFSVTLNIANQNVVFTGNTETNYQFESNTYTILNLTSTAYPGKIFQIFKPYFQENVGSDDFPPAPSWMPNTNLSPGAMIMACDGVFASNVAQYNYYQNLDPNNNPIDSVALGAVEDAIVSAFNRGIAAKLSSPTQIAMNPNDWANQPLVTGAAAGTTTNATLADGTYYYLVTATTHTGETTPSLEFMATVTGPQNSVNIAWQPISPYDATTAPLGFVSYNIYRSTTEGTGYQLIDTVTNVSNPVPTIGYNDVGGQTPTNQTPPMYYAPGTSSNWYAAFLHTNNTTNPISGVSVNGLGYGFAYDDEGGQSSDFTAYTPTQISITLLPWTTRSSVPSQPNPNPLPAPPTSPTLLPLSNQPNNVKAGVSQSVSFQALTAQNYTYFGGANITVTLVTSNSNQFVASLGTVTTDSVSGIGTLKFNYGTAGTYKLKFTLADGTFFYSSPFQVISSKMLGKKKK